MTGTIPIYYGPDCIGDYFNTKGMIIFKDVAEMDNILQSLDEDLYNQMLPYAKENFELAKQYILSEDWMYENGVYDKMGIK